MFLAKYPSRVCCLYSLDENGKRRRVPTKCRLKSDALRFLRSFKEEEENRQVKRTRTTTGGWSPVKELTQKVIEQVSIHGEVRGRLIFLYYEATRPTLNKKNMDAYSKKLEILVKLDVSGRV